MHHCIQTTELKEIWGVSRARSTLRWTGTRTVEAAAAALGSVGGCSSITIRLSSHLAKGRIRSFSWALGLEDGGVAAVWKPEGTAPRNWSCLGGKSMLLLQEMSLKSLSWSTELASSAFMGLL